MEDFHGSAESYFERRGYIELAWVLLKDSVHQIASDPEQKLAATREEIAWLKGDLAGAPVKVDEVFVSLGIAEWAPKFADLAIKDPATLKQRVDSLTATVRELMAAADPEPAVSYVEEPSSIDDYRDRARAC
jgi:hypothetical protein